LVSDLVRRSIFNNPDRNVRVLAEQFFPRSGGPGVEEAASLEGDVARGQAVFYSRCASCHIVGQVGSDIGPDLSPVGAKFTHKALLEKIANPSRDVAHGYLPSVVTMSAQEVADVTAFLLRQN
jgi:mono/diheme cytochrome c family protein